MTANLFHPAVATWFERSFPAATAAQAAAWPAIQAGRHVLVAAPTGSGKTLAAFLAAIDQLIREGSERAERGERGERDEPALPDETSILYVSPLKALSNDIQRNLERPLAGIRDCLRELGAPDVEINTLVRTGDTPQAERARMRKRAPHIVITTPESLYVLLGSASGRKMLASTRTVIVDEIHALAGNKRGSHLALSLARLEALAGRVLVRIGLSATQKPIESIAQFLIGADQPLEACTIVDSGHARPRDLAIEVPNAPLEAVMSGDVWRETYDRLAALAAAHRTTLVFVNTRRTAERVTRHLAERLGAEHVAAHHGSLAKELRFDAEQRLRAGQLKALVATASLELGIDIGDVDLVCQVGSCRSIATFLQRAGRSGHAVGGTPKARLFPLSRDELAESIALFDAVRRGELDRILIPTEPLDVLAQQIVAEVAACESGYGEDELFELVRRASPYRDLKRETFIEVVRMLAEGFATRRGQARQYLHRDVVNHRLRARRGAALTEITSGGTIPDNADYDVLLEPADLKVGTVNEDFAIESMQGDIFQLGNTSYRILRVEGGKVRVEDARGAPPTIPFWLGEAPGRSDELSNAVSRLRENLAGRIESAGAEAALAYLIDELDVAPAAAEQLVDYLAAAHAALGCLPTARQIVFERFFDETGGTQLVIHSPYGSRINRAWGLALRKRFCVKFNFELQAAATEDTIILSLSTSHSFELAEVARYLSAKSVREVLIQALIAAPMFTARWRWAASIALAIPRYRGGNKVPPQLQRMIAEDLIADVFPDQIACAENLSGPRAIPDHPLVRQAIADCLHDAMDIDGLERLLAAIASGEVAIVARDTVEPSPLALEILSARPYAFLDDAPLEERRTQAVMSRRWLDPSSASDLGQLDAAAIARVREEAFPSAETADELHDALLWFGFLTDAEIATRPDWPAMLTELVAARRVTHAGAMWVAAERLPQFIAICGDARLDPPITAPEEARRDWTREDAIRELVRARLEGLGPIDAVTLGAPLGLSIPEAESALISLEGEGVAMRGSFTAAESRPSIDPSIDPAASASIDATKATLEWCNRRLLARIHRYTVDRLRREIEPVSAQDFMRFLLSWQRVAPSDRMEGPDALATVIGQLEGFEAAAAAWETELLPDRLNDYDFTWLDDLCLAGRAVWLRLSRPRPAAEPPRRAGPVRSTPIALVPRRNAGWWGQATLQDDPPAPILSSRGAAVHAWLTQHGATFFDELVAGTGLLGAQVEEALAELVALGWVTADSFAGLRALLVPLDRRKPSAGARRHRRTVAFGIEDAGRWALVRRPIAALAGPESAAMVEHVARTLLRRYGVVCWRLLAREAEWLPPWRDLLRAYRRLEARGEIRGGRFVAGITGEQYALPEAVSALRELRRQPLAGTLVAVSGADPLNLVGIVVPGAKVPALTSNRVLYRDGAPLATWVGGTFECLEKLSPELEWQAKNALIRRSTLSPQLAYLR